MTNFHTAWGMLQNSPPQSFYAQTRSLLPGEGDTLPSVIPTADSLPAASDGYEIVRVVIYGSHWGVNYTIRWLYNLKFAHIGEWSFVMPVPGSSQMMSILTKRIPSERTV